MLIIGDGFQEPPFVENPEPGFGEVILKMDEVALVVETRTVNYNTTIPAKLAALNDKVTAFINDTLIPANAHLNQKGALHGETKVTVGLSKKDNYRTATVQEQIDYVPVNAFVTPLGVKRSLEANLGIFDPKIYQANDAFQFASYYYPDDYPTSRPAVPEAIRYATPNGRVAMLFNGDRVVVSPRFDATQYTRNSLFVSLPMTGDAGMSLSEITNVPMRYLSNNWNAAGADTSDGKVCFFRPLADKQIYNYSSALGLPAGNRNYLLYQRFGALTYKGLGVVAVLSGTTLTLSHKFFKVDAAATNPNMTELLTSAYTALFDCMGGTPAAAPLNGSHTYNLADFVDLPAGATIARDTEGLGPVTTLIWNSTDFEAYFNVSIAVVVTKGGVKTKLNLSFTESIIPGTLVSGGTGTVKTLGPRVKDALDEDLLPTVDAAFLSINNRFDLNNITQIPGVVLNSGMLIKSASMKHGIRVKRYRTEFPGIKAWLMAKRPVIDPVDVVTEMFVPARHSPFGALPERIIPVLHNSSFTQFLVYGLDTATGLFSWTLKTWEGNNILGVVTGDKFGVELPSVSERLPSMGLMPSSMVCTVNKASNGASISGIGLTTGNLYTGKASVTFVNKVLNVGAKVKLSQPNLILLQTAASGVMTRAATANPAVNPALRKAEIQIFGVTNNRALICISDGLSYAEVMATPYTITSGVMLLNFTPTNGLVTLTRVTPNGAVAVTGNRESGSRDRIWADCADLHCLRESADVFTFVLTRPFGANYGDVSFSVTDFTAVTPTYTVRNTNPARLYPGKEQIDAVDELLPPLLIPRKGAYQFDLTNTDFTSRLLEVGGTTNFDMFDVNEVGWVRVPAGGRMVLGGRTYVMTREFTLKANPTGTTYCYMQRLGDTLVAIGSPTKREPANNEVLFGIAVNGVLQQTRDYMVLANHVVTATRQGAGIPCFTDDGANGVNQFFTTRDVS